MGQYSRSDMTAQDHYQQLPLGAEGVEYIRACLLDGRSLSHAVAAANDLDSGAAIAYLPPGIQALSAGQFRAGGVASAARSEDVVGNALGQMLVEDGRILVGEDQLRRCSDAAIVARPHGVVCYLDEVYHLGTRDGVDDQSIRGVLRRTRSAMCGELLFVTRWAGEIPTSWPNRITDLGLLAGSVEAIAAGAFDGEGYVVWKRSRSV